MVYILFFLSGLSALIFETLWFRLAGLTFGNSVWAGSIVLSSFMGGLALGSYLTSRYGWKVTNAIKWYAALELLIGVLGFLLVVFFPSLSAIFSSAFYELNQMPAVLNLFRLILAFCLMIIPATAMGATLPLLVKYLFSGEQNFGAILGRLYGWNTLGAMIGAVAGDLVLIGEFGIIGTGGIALVINVSIAILVFFIPKQDKKVVQPPHIVKPFSSKSIRLLLASFLAGTTLLALEVVWFRFNSLFLLNTSLNFSLMLAVVLMGIGLGGHIASLVLKRFKHHNENIFVYALLSGALVLCGYMFLAYKPAEDFFSFSQLLNSLSLVLPLMLPVSILSGILFTFMGQTLKEELQDETRSAALLVLFNTIGATIGALLGGFVLLPMFGMEKSLFILALGYIAIAVLMVDGKMFSTARKRMSFAFAGLLLVFCVVLFPFGMMRNYFFNVVLSKHSGPNEELIAQKEGLCETVFLTRQELYRETILFRLLTNGYAMSGRSLDVMRYMNAYAHWPGAFNPTSEDALLISFGAGNTARAICNYKQLKTIDIVDISQEIIDMSHLIYPLPDENPINDPRVEIHIEDGRHFLLTQKKQYDFITAEPPPPKNAGIVNLYTKEYFQLVYNRLKEEGIVTYWLPVDQLTQKDTLAIIRGFLEVFPDVTLWNIRNYDWMLMGTKTLNTEVPYKLFSQQWQDPVVGPELVALGFETPGFLLSTFIADGEYLNNLTKNSPPLIDNYPYRIGQDFTTELEFFSELMNPQSCLERFTSSSWVKQVISPEAREEAIQVFSYQEQINKHFSSTVFTWEPKIDLETIKTLDPILVETPFSFLVLSTLNSSQSRIEIAGRALERGYFDKRIIYQLMVQSIKNRDFELALEHLSDLEARVDVSENPNMGPFRVYLHLLSGDVESARKAAEDVFHASTTEDPILNDYWGWLKERFQLDWQL